MTSPLREMTEATRRMARGDYRGRVRADSSDEIGEAGPGVQPDGGRARHRRPRAAQPRGDGLPRRGHRFLVTNLLHGKRQLESFSACIDVLELTKFTVGIIAAATAYPAATPGCASATL